MSHQGFVSDRRAHERIRVELRGDRGRHCATLLLSPAPLCLDGFIERLDERGVIQICFRVLVATQNSCISRQSRELHERVAELCGLLGAEEMSAAANEEAVAGECVRWLVLPALNDITYVAGSVKRREDDGTFQGPDTEGIILPDFSRASWDSVTFSADDLDAGNVLSQLTVTTRVVPMVVRGEYHLHLLHADLAGNFKHLLRLNRVDNSRSSCGLVHNDVHVVVLQCRNGNDRQ